MLNKSMNGAEALIKALIENDVDTVFGYPGGAVLPVYDAIFKNNRIKHILVRHEQAAVHAAEGFARSTGKVGCVLVTSGPGATNAITGLTDALMDSVPLVCITGQVPTHLIGTDAFQEADTTGISRPATKHNYLVKKPKDLCKVVHEAFDIASTGRPGPVLIDLPKDIQNSKTIYYENIKLRSNLKIKKKENYKQNTKMHINYAINLIKTSKKPVVYIGGGLINSGHKASIELEKFSKLTNFPITSTLMGLGAFPASNQLFLGMLGMHGTYEANMSMHDCDLMINLGARFDDRITGRLDGFSPNSKKIHIDIDPSSINKNVEVDLPIIGDVSKILRLLNNFLNSVSSTSFIVLLINLF